MCTDLFLFSLIEFWNLALPLVIESAVLNLSRTWKLKSTVSLVLHSSITCWGWSGFQGRSPGFVGLYCLYWRQSLHQSSTATAVQTGQQTRHTKDKDTVLQKSRVKWGQGSFMKWGLFFLGKIEPYIASADWYKQMVVLEMSQCVRTSHVVVMKYQ